MRTTLRDGDLLRHTGTGSLRQVKGESFTKRFMDREDYEMEAHGMGHYAGVYTGAIRAVALDIETHGGMVGATYTMKLGDVSSDWVNLTAQEEADEGA